MGLERCGESLYSLRFIKQLCDLFAQLGHVATHFGWDWAVVRGKSIYSIELPFMDLFEARGMVEGQHLRMLRAVVRLWVVVALRKESAPEYRLGWVWG